MRHIPFLIHHPAFPALLGMALCGGCALFGPAQPERFQVESSALDTLDILYIPDTETPRFKFPARLTFFGSGQIRLRSGLSPQVIDSFASDPTDPHWNHYHEDNAGFQPGEIRVIFQRLVDAGMVYANITGPKNPDPVGLPRLQIAGKINGHKIIRLTDNPEMVAIVEHILDWFAR